MKVFTILLLCVISIPLFAGGKDESTQNAMEGAMMEAEPMESESMGMEQGAMMGGLEDFTGLDNAMVQAESQPVVLFFYATWCPSCQVSIKDLKAREGEFGKIQVLIVNYDKSDELKMKYGVTYQHTYVQIDSSGNALEVWNGGDTDELLANTRVEEM